MSKVGPPKQRRHKRKKAVSLKDLPAIKELFDQGLSQMAIAKKLDAAESSVRNIMNECGLKRTQEQKTAIFIQTMRAKYNDKN